MNTIAFEIIASHALKWLVSFIFAFSLLRRNQNKGEEKRKEKTVRHDPSFKSRDLETQQREKAKKLRYTLRVTILLSLAGLIFDEHPEVYFPLLIISLLASMRLDAFEQINSNDLTQPDFYELLDHYAPRWINPEIPNDPETLHQYEQSKRLDEVFINEGVESLGKGELAMPKRRLILPTEQTLSQCFNFTNQTINYLIKSVKSSFDVGKRHFNSHVYGLRKEITDDTIASFLLNSSIGILSKVEIGVHEGAPGVFISFHRGGFALPYKSRIGCFDNEMKIVVFIPDEHQGVSNLYDSSLNPAYDNNSSFDSSALSLVSGAKVLEFQTNFHMESSHGLRDLENQQDRLHAMVVFLAIVTHPLIHSFSDALIRKINHAAREGLLVDGIDRIALYGNGFNDISSFPLIFLSGRFDKWMKQMSTYNSGLPIPFGREHGKNAMILARYSRSYSFCPKLWKTQF